MYIAVLGEDHQQRYELRRTTQGAGRLTFETLFDFGSHLDHQVRFDRFAIIYADELLDCVLQFHLDQDKLDQAVLPFAPPGFQLAPTRSQPWTRTILTQDQVEAIRSLHAFDRRRMAYLRSGEVNLSRINEVHPKLFKNLVGKCRDELEQVFLIMERELPVEEQRRYIYASFNLQRHFTTLAARTMPESVDPDRLDEVFLLEFCALHKDASFQDGLPDEIEAYLRRYAYMHFDMEFFPTDEFAQIFNDFMNAHRRHRPRQKPIVPTRVQELFGYSPKEIHSMSKRDFARIFRNLAMTMHPDKGGDHERFVELLDLYKQLMRQKSS